MARPRDKSPDALRELSDYYKLNTQCVEDLVTANEENSPPVSKEELGQYRSASGFHLSRCLKAVLLKAWFAGAVCFFVFWGLGMYVPNALDMFLVFGVCLGMVTDLLVNSILRFAAATPGENDGWMMFPKRGVPAFLLNIGYGLVLLLCVDGLYQLLNTLLLALGCRGSAQPLGVEPIFFGLFYMGFDLLFLGLRSLGKRIFSQAMERAGKES